MYDLLQLQYDIYEFIPYGRDYVLGKKKPFWPVRTFKIARAACCCAFRSFRAMDCKFINCWRVSGFFPGYQNGSCTSHIPGTYHTGEQHNSSSSSSTAAQQQYSGTVARCVSVVVSLFR